MAEAGDAALVAVTTRLRGTIRHIDHAFRIGGDEFAVVLAPFYNRAHVDAVIERIGQAMEPPLLLPGGATIRAGLSVGVAVYPDDGVSPQDLTRRADARMYHHKRERDVAPQQGV